MRLLLETRAHRYGGSLGFSFVIHTGVISVLLWFALAPGPPVEIRRATPIKEIVWLQQPGPGGGGGGGGNRSVEPPRKEPLAVPEQNKPDVQPVNVPEDALPLPDASIDRVLIVHCLEMVADPHDHLREIWRVLTPGGRVILVVPNRSGIWARTEKTPFGHGQPYGSGQLTGLLREAQLSPFGWTEALALPPIRGPWLRSGTTWERVGRTLWPAFAGVIIVEATKQLYQRVAVRERRSRIRSALRPAWIPPGAAPVR